MYIKIYPDFNFGGYYSNSTVSCLEDEAAQQLVKRHGDILFYVVDSNLAWVSNKERSLPCDAFVQGFFFFVKLAV